MKRRIVSRAPRQIRLGREYPYDPRKVEPSPEDLRKMDLMKQELRDRYERGEMTRTGPDDPQSITDANTVYQDLFTRWQDGDDPDREYDKAYNDFEHQLESG